MTQHPFTTPLHGAQTPSYGAYGSRTPMHDGSRTPHYGNMVEIHCQSSQSLLIKEIL